MAVEGEALGIPIDFGEPLTAELKAFMNSIRDRSQPLADGQAGYEALKIVEACYESSQSGKRVVLDWEKM